MNSNIFLPTTFSTSARKAIEDISFGDKSRSLVTSLSIARTIAYNQILPTAIVEDINSFYNLSIRTNVKSIISKINEIISIDVETIESFVEKFYLLRYNQINPTMVPECNTETPILAYFDISRFFDPVTLKVIEDSCADISRITKMVIVIYNEIIKDQNQL